MPSIVNYDVKVEGLMQADSMQNTQGEVQTPIKKNDDEDFEAGAKHNFNAWTTWDDDDDQ